MKLCFDLVSLLTLSGLSFRERSAAALCPAIFAAAVAVLYGPLNLLRRRGKKRSPSSAAEGLGYALFFGLSALLAVLLPASRSGFALLLMLAGGCRCSLAGGFSVLPLCRAVKLISRSVVLRTHPSAVAALREGGSVLSTKEASDNALDVILYFAVHLVISFVLCFECPTFSDAMLLAAAAMGNTGIWLALLGCGVSADTLSAGMQLFLCAVMLCARVHWVRRLPAGRKSRG